MGIKHSGKTTSFAPLSAASAVASQPITTVSSLLNGRTGAIGTAAAVKDLSPTCLLLSVASQCLCTASFARDLPCPRGPSGHYKQGYLRSEVLEGATGEPWQILLRGLDTSS